MKRYLTFVLILTLTASAVARQQVKPVQADPNLVRAEYRDLSYGPHERNTLDIWLARSEDPTPVVVFFHGGGFRAGDKSQLRPVMLNALLKQGISVAAANYRLTNSAPFPAQMHDAARAVQFIRSKAADWHIDKKRFAAFGGSAGAGISMWLAFHDDLADPNSKDSVARQSTRLTCAGAVGGQSTYDPHVMRQWFEVSFVMNHPHPALRPFYGVDSPADFEKPEVRELMVEASPITHLTKDDVPVFCQYGVANDKVTADTPRSAWAHHPIFGIKLQEQMEELGIECALQYPAFKNHDYKNMIDFFIKKLKPTN
jgi:acetyl esterase/lipase